MEWVRRPLPSAIVGPTASDDIADDFSPAQDGPCEIRAVHSDVIPVSEIRMNSPDYPFASERSAWVHRAAFVRRRACLEASRTTGSWREWRRRRRSHRRSAWSSMGDRFGDIPVVPIRRGRRCGALSDSPRCERDARVQWRQSRFCFVAFPALSLGLLTADSRSAPNEREARAAGKASPARGDDSSARRPNREAFGEPAWGRGSRRQKFGSSRGPALMTPEVACFPGVPFQV